MPGPARESDNAPPLFGAEYTKEGRCPMSDEIRGMDQNAHHTRNLSTPTR